jgi:hypothetical protein
LLKAKNHSPDQYTPWKYGQSDRKSDHSSGDKQRKYEGFVSLQQFTEGDNPYAEREQFIERSKKKSILEGVGRDSIMLNRASIINAAKARIQEGEGAGMRRPE